MKEFTMEPTSVNVETWFPAGRKHISEYYNNEFKNNVQYIPKYLEDMSKISEFGFALVEPVKTTTFKKEFLRRKNEHMIHKPYDIPKTCLDIKTYDPLNELLENEQIAGLYFALNNIRDIGWILAFDIDAKMIAQTKKCPYHDTSEQAMYLPPMDTNPKTYPYCFNCIQIALNQAFEIKDILSDEWGFDKQSINIIYSGQGAHVHVTDPYACSFSKEPREFIQEILTKRYDICLDPTVTSDARRVLRVPGSLNSRVNQPVKEIKTGNLQTILENK